MGVLLSKSSQGVWVPIIQKRAGEALKQARAKSRCQHPHSLRTWDLGWLPSSEAWDFPVLSWQCESDGDYFRSTGKAGKA